MAGESSTVPLAKYCLRITKGTTPTTLGRPFVTEGINFVKSEAITPDGRIDPSTFAFIDSETHRYLSRSILQESDVLFSMAGMHLGKTAVVPRSILPANTNQAVGIIRVDQTKADPRFIHYTLSLVSVRNLVHRSVAQSAQPNFNLRDIGNLPIPNLPLREQQVIAHILGTLDDKIELNRWMNETLEAMARAIFKSWFVDFDPVRAKAEGRQPYGMYAETAVLFPDSFEDSPLGKIPKGWQVGKMAEFVTLRREAVSPGDSPNEVFDHYSIPAFDEGRWPKEETGEQIKSNKFLVPRDAVLLSKLNPRLPRVWLPTVSGVRRSIASTEFLVASPHRDFSREYIFALFSSQAFLDVFETLVTGTSGSHQRVKPEFLVAIDVVVPSRQCVESFTRVAGSLYEKSTKNLDESHTLSTIRDVLLPKLISGEVRVLEPKNRLGRV